MRVIASHGNEEIARVFVAITDDMGPNPSKIEFVESVQPPLPREKKWVLIVSTLKGCPVNCPLCDAGGDYNGLLSSEEIFDQIDYLVSRRFPSSIVSIPKLKIQFARMGDPAFNHHVLEVLRLLPTRYHAPGLMPCLSTIAPHGHARFFDELVDIKNDLYQNGRFQMQFSIHTTDEKQRSKLIPWKIWSFKDIASYGQRFFREGDRKITLNFATPKGFPLEPEILLNCFSPSLFAVKLTPVNPTFSAKHHEFTSLIDPHNLEETYRLVERCEKAGFETILSIGELSENAIGSNCGMYTRSMD